MQVQTKMKCVRILGKGPSKVCNALRGWRVGHMPLTAGCAGIGNPLQKWTRIFKICLLFLPLLSHS